MVNKYIPKQGDIVLLDFNPTKGHEQNGKIPAIVISNNIFNKNTRRVIVCPITSNEKNSLLIIYLRIQKKFMVRYYASI